MGMCFYAAVNVPALRHWGIAHLIPRGTGLRPAELWPPAFPCEPKTHLAEV